MTEGTDPKEAAVPAAAVSETPAKVEAAQPLSEEQLDVVSGGLLMPYEKQPDKL